MCQTRKSNVNVPIRPFALSYRPFETIYIIESVSMPSYSALPLSPHHFSPSIFSQADCMTQQASCQPFIGVHKHTSTVMVFAKYVESSFLLVCFLACN